MSTLTNTSLPKSFLTTKLSKTQMVNKVYSELSSMSFREQADKHLISACHIPLLGWFLNKLGINAEVVINKNDLVFGSFPGVTYKLIMSNVVIASGYFFRDGYDCKNWGTETLSGVDITNYECDLKLESIIEMFQKINEAL